MALVVFLRGVNVGGHKTFRPSILAQQLKHFDVVNVGAAGTFIIRKPANQAELRAELQRRLPFETEAMICTSRELITMASGEPFGDEPISSDAVRFVSVLAKRPRVLPNLPLCFPPEGAWLLKILAVKNRFVFGMYRRQMKAIRYLSMIDTVLGVRVTTRNWNTFTAIVKLLKSSRETTRTRVESS
jgi:uncharacterized protein (DUF1697 family)